MEEVLELCAQYTWWQLAIAAGLLGAASVSVADLLMRVRRWWLGAEEKQDEE